MEYLLRCQEVVALVKLVAASELVPALNLEQVFPKDCLLLELRPELVRDLGLGYPNDFGYL